MCSCSMNHPHPMQVTQDLCDIKVHDSLRAAHKRARRTSGAMKNLCPCATPALVPHIAWGHQATADWATLVQPHREAPPKCPVQSVMSVHTLEEIPEGSFRTTSSTTELWQSQFETFIYRCSHSQRVRSDRFWSILWGFTSHIQRH
jgi:hypothetical protein